MKEPDLLTRVLDTLSGHLDIRALRHPGRPGAVAVRSSSCSPAFLDAAAAALEAEGLEVERKPGWLEVVAPTELGSPAATSKRTARTLEVRRERMAS